jgi:ATP-dependent helicase/nuclease subunit A
MCLAARRGTLHREQPFLLGVPAAELVSEAGDQNELVLVRGIIDSYFEEDGDVILVDYKTDRVGQQTGESVLTERYKAQLKYYKRAIQASQKKEVKQAFLYSFTLGREIEVLL